MTNRLIREHFTIDGEPKVARTKWEAETYALQNDLVAYRCKFCGSWHVGKESWDERRKW